MQLPLILQPCSTRAPTIPFDPIRAFYSLFMMILIVVPPNVPVPDITLPNEWMILFIPII